MSSDSKRYVDYLNFTGLAWKRQEVPTPRVWRVVNGRRKTADGKIPKFSIQEVPKHLKDEVMEFVATYFLSEEPVNVERGTNGDPLAVRVSRTLWRDALRQGVNVVALKVNSDATAQPIIANDSTLSALTLQDEATLAALTQFRSAALSKSMVVQLQLMQESNVLER